MNGCDRCTLRIDKTDWNSIDSLSAELRSAVLAKDAEWADDASARLRALVEKIEADQP